MSPQRAITHNIFIFVYSYSNIDISLRFCVLLLKIVSVFRREIIDGTSIIHNRNCSDCSRDSSIGTIWSVSILHLYSVVSYWWIINILRS